MRPTIRLALLAVAATAVLAACSGAATPSPSPAVSPSPATSPSPEASPSPEVSPSPAVSPSSSPAASPSGASTTVMVADSSLGKILVDGAGRTLYLFTKDTGSDSTCYDACAASWPALTSTGELSVGSGLDDGDFATTTRTDGTTQITFYGKPLYYFAGDQKAGDTKGQGLNSVWYVVSPEGQPITG